MAPGARDLLVVHEPRLLVVIFLRQSLKLFKKDETAVRWNLELLATGFAGDIVVDADEVVLRFLEDRPVARIGAAGHLCFLRAAEPPD